MNKNRISFSFSNYHIINKYTKKLKTIVYSLKLRSIKFAFIKLHRYAIYDHYNSIMISNIDYQNNLKSYISNKSYTKSLKLVYMNHWKYYLKIIKKIYLD